MLKKTMKHKVHQENAPGRFEWNFDSAVFKLILVTDGWGIFYKTTLGWMSLNPTDVNIGLGNGFMPSANKPLP